MLSLFLSRVVAGVCPSCPVGETARQQVIDDGFGMHLLVAVLPFLLVGLASRWAYGMGR